MIVRSPRELGLLVRDRRLQNRLTQADLASQVGVSRKWIVDLEAGKRAIDLSLVLRTLNTLGLELDARERRTRPAKDATIDVDHIVDATRRRKA